MFDAITSFLEYLVLVSTYQFKWNLNMCKIKCESKDCNWENEKNFESMKLKREIENHVRIFILCFRKICLLFLFNNNHIYEFHMRSWHFERIAFLFSSILKIFSTHTISHAACTRIHLHPHTHTYARTSLHIYYARRICAACLLLSKF